MRKTILSVIAQSNLELIDNAKIKASQIEQFDEIFLSNSIQGIQWVGAYKNKRYDNKITKQIHQQLLSVIFNR